MIALDLDGTLISLDRATDAVNVALLHELRQRGARRIAICTNQGGIPFRIMGSERYPSAADFGRRLLAVGRCAWTHGVSVEAVRVACYHPKATPAAIERAARELRPSVAHVCPNWHVYASEAARKPHGLMLRSVGATEYWGDSEDDAGAAADAGIPFVRIERF